MPARRGHGRRSRGPRPRSTAADDRPADAALERDLRRVLDDVRAAVGTGRRMQRGGARDLRPVGGPDRRPPARPPRPRELLRWLVDDNFTFLGQRRAAPVDGDRGHGPGSGLGCCAPTAGSAGGLEREVPRARPAAPLLSLNKAGDPLDRAPAGLPRRRRRCRPSTPPAGWWASSASSACSPPSAYTESVLRIPVVRRKVARRARAVRASPAPATPAATCWRSSRRSRATSCSRPASRTCDRIATCRAAAARAPPAAAVPAPRRLPAATSPRSSTCRATATRRGSALAMSNVLRRRSASRASTTPPGSPSPSSPGCTSSCAATRRRSLPDVDVRALEARLAAVAALLDRRPRRGRGDDARRPGGRRAAADLRRGVPRGLQGGLPRGHRAARRRSGWPRSARRARSRWRRTPARARPPDQRRLKLYRDGPLSLSDVLPVLQSLGVDVLDERPYELDCGDGRSRWVYDFGLRYRAGAAAPSRTARTTCSPTPSPRSGRGQAEDDGFNALVTRGRLTWRQVVVLRAYATLPAAGVLDVQLRVRPGGARHATSASPACWCSCSRRSSTRRASRPVARAGRGARRRGHRGARRRREPGPRPDPARAARARAGHRCAPTTSSRDELGAPKPLPLAQARPRSGCPTCRRPAPGTRSSSTARASRACTCASGRSRAAGCAGRTGATTSAPRCSGWSRRRW